MTHTTDFIEAHRDEFIRYSHDIHAHPEIGNEEYYASDVLTTILKSHDFTVERNISGYETGFIASYKSDKDGPTIGYLAEYDSLPGLGHACGHNIIGVTSVLAAINLKQHIDSIGGSVIVYGTPAEEGGPNGSAKAKYADDGLFTRADVALMAHPGHDHSLTQPTLAVDVFDVFFHGKSQHAANPSIDGQSALDAMIQFYNGISLLRQHTAPNDLIHGVILNGGDAANIIPEKTHARFYTRSRKRTTLNALTDRVKEIAKGAALATNTSVKFEFIQNGVNEFIRTPQLDALYKEAANTFGITIDDVEERYGSTDTGNVSHIIPTIHPHIKIGPSTLVGHTDEFREAAISQEGDQGLINGAKILSKVGYRLIQDADLLNRIKSEHEVALKGAHDESNE